MPRLGVAVGIFHVAFLVRRAVTSRDVLLVEVLLFYECKRVAVK